MKQTENLTTPRKAWGRMQDRKLFMVLAGLVLAGGLTMPGFAADNYKLTIAPANVAPGNHSFTVTITNCDVAACGAGNETSPSSHAIRAIDLFIPSGFSGVVLGTVTATGTNNTGGTNVWHHHGIAAPNKIRLRPGASGHSGNGDGNQKLDPGESVSIQFTASVGCAAGNRTWTAALNNNVVSDTTDVANDWNLIAGASTPTVTVACGIPMPVNKLINGESATCTGAPPDANGNQNEARTCSYTQAGLVLVAGDPRFDMNVYSTANNLPGVTLGIPAPGLSFPQPGVKIPPEFNIPGGIPIGTHFTMCEAPDMTTSPTPYTLTSVTVTVTGGGMAGTYNMPIYFHQGHACFNTYPTFLNGVPAGATEFAVDLNNSIVCSYTKGGYGQDFGNNTIGGILSSNFPTVFPNGVQVGDRTTLGTLDGNTNGWGALFTSPAAIRAYLPVQGGAGSIEGALTADYTDPSGSQPTSRPKGFAEQVLALQMNIDLGDAGAFLPGGGGIGNFMVFTGAGQCGDGKTVRQILAEANAALAGLTPLPANCSVASLQQLTDNLNNSYDDCRVGVTSNLFIRPVPAQ